MSRDLRVSEFLEATFESMDQGITIYDSDLRLVAWNKRYTEMETGIDPKFLKYGISLLDLYRASAASGLFGPGDPEELAQKHIDAIKNGPLIEVETLTPVNGKLIRVNRYFLKNNGICATFRDITEERKLEDELRQSHNMEALGRLAGGVAHDINNILTVIQMNAELLLARCVDHQEKVVIQGMLSAAQRGGDVTGRLLTLSRKQSLQPLVICVSDLLESMSQLLHATIGRHIELSVNLPDDLWTCKIDPYQLEVALLNIASNARDAMPDGGRLTVTAQNVVQYTEEPGSRHETGQDFIRISVTDTGHGMNSKEFSHAFDPFYTTKAVGNGTGLGLALVHGFVTQSNGTVSIDTSPAGTTIHLFLPRSEQSVVVRLREQDKPTMPQQAARSEVHQQVVLIVEDESALRQVLMELLGVLGYSTLAAADGKQGLLMLESANTIDILLTDLVLPGDISGQDLAKMASELRPNIHTLFMSGYSEDELFASHEVNALETLIQKPFKLDQLRAELEKLTAIKTEVHAGHS